MGRKTKLNEEKIKELCAALPTALYVETAANMVGIPHRTLRHWLKRGREARAKAERDHTPIPKSEQIYASLAEEIRKAVASSQIHALRCVHEAATAGQWQAAAWLLERRFPNLFGRDRGEVRALKKRIEELEAQLAAASPSPVVQAVKGH